MNKNNLFDKALERAANEKKHTFRKILAGIVVFATTYSLILPAITLEANQAEEDPGIVLTEEPVTAEETSADRTPEEAAYVQDTAVMMETEPVSAEETAAMPSAELEKIIESTEYKIVARADENILPAGTVLEAEIRTEENDPQLYAAVNDILEGREIDHEDMIRIIFKDSDGNEIQPAGTVEIRIESDLKDYDKKPIIVSARESDDSAGQYETEILDETDNEITLDKNEPETGRQTLKFRTDKTAFFAAAYEKKAELATEDAQIQTETASEPQENAEETVETEETAPVIITETAEDFVFFERAGGLDVNVQARHDAFPQGTVMAVVPVNNDNIETAVTEAVDGKIRKVQAVDITFIDTEGNEVQPAVPIKVVITPSEAPKQAEDVSVVHVDDKANAEVVQDVTATENTVEFAADKFSVYAVVYTVDFEYNVDGKTYTFSMEGGTAMSFRQLMLNIGVVSDEAEAESFINEVDNVTFSDPSLVNVYRNNKFLFWGENDWVIESLQPFSTEEALTVTMKDGQVFAVKVTDEQGADFTVSVEFKDAEGNLEQQASGCGLNVYLAAKMKDGNNEGIYWFVKEIDPKDGKAEINVTQLDRQNANPDKYSIQDILNASKSIEVKLLKNGYEIEQNGSPRGTIKSGEVSNGSVYNGYELSITTDGTTSARITAQKPKPYTYTVKAMDQSKVEDIAFTEGPWYLYGEVTRPDGVYFYVRKIENGGEITGTVDKLERYTGVNSRQGETVPATNDYISFALLRPKDSGQSDQPGYFWTSDNMNVKALSGSSVDSKYTLEVVAGESHSDIILRKGPEAEIELTSYDESEAMESAPVLEKNGSYFIVGELSFRDGLEDKNCYYIEKVTGTQSQKVSKQYFTGKNDEIQYLTGTRSFEPVLVFDPDSSATAETILGKLINKDSSITVYRTGDAVESYRMTSENGTLEQPEGKIKLNKLPVLNAAGEIQDKDGNAVAKKDNETYSLLVEITRDGKKAYAYQPLVFDGNGRMAPVRIADTFIEQSSNETWYYCEEDTPKFYVVKGAAENHDAAVASAERYAAGQLMGTYTPSFTFDENSNTVTTVLKETEEVAGTRYSVRIDMMNKEQTDVEEVDPALSGNYYVLATLTPKGTGSKGQTVAWNVMKVDLSDLNPDGTWSGTIPADGFNVCNANMDSNGTKIGYNADKYDINLRLYHSNNEYTTYKDIREHADDSAPSGYDFKGVYTKDNDPITGTRKLTEENTSVIRLHKAYDKVYGLRAYVDHPGLDLPAGDYVVKVKLLHETGEDTYAFAKLKIDPTVGGDTPAELEFYSDDKGRIWRDQNGGLQDGSNYTFTGNEKGVELTLMSLTNGGESFAEWTKDPSQTNTYTVIKPGESLKLYTFTFGDREEEENVAGQKHYVYDVLHFTEDVNGISKAELDEKLKQARDFGLYTELLSKHATDMESNIGAAVLSGEIGADYGFSGNNIKVNRITVIKQYYENNLPVSKQVTLRLYPVETYDEETGNYTLGDMISEKQGNTNDKGILKLEFDKLPAGKYVLKEVLNGKEYDFNYGGSEDGKIVDDNTVIQFQDRIIDIENINVNYNYFGDIMDNVSLPPILSHSRHGLIVVGNDQDYEALKNANGGEVSPEGTTVKKAGADPDYPVLDIPEDMKNLRDLSNLLGESANSKTVRVINTTYDEINGNNGLKLKSDGRYIVVNIDMTTAPSVATVNLDTYIDNHRLLADFGADGNEDSSKVLYNFITKDPHGNISNYTGKINTATQAAGVILAPSAIVADLGGNWGGTIICKEAQHTGSEIHSDSANKIQNKNTMLTNGSAEKGNLELIKSFAEESDDRTTWFTFKVTAKNKDNTPLTGEYSATSLKDGDKVTFNEQGVAMVQVRAQNKVFIVGLPDGVTYHVDEVDTPETELYNQDHMIPADGNGIIEKDKTSSVNVVNTKAGLFEFTKIWKTAEDTYQEWPDGKTITVTLWSKTDGSNPKKVGTFTLNAAGGKDSAEKYSFTGIKNNDNTYTFKITGIPTKENGKSVTYYVTEAQVEGYLSPAYAFKDSSGAIKGKTGENAGFAEHKEYIINRPDNSFGLPKTGGIGTNPFTACGAIILGCAAVLYVYRNYYRKNQLELYSSSREGGAKM